jgi:hypothetical protein
MALRSYRERGIPVQLHGQHILQREKKPAAPPDPRYRPRGAVSPFPTPYVRAKLAFRMMGSAATTALAALPAGCCAATRCRCCWPPTPLLPLVPPPPPPPRRLGTISCVLTSLLVRLCATRCPSAAWKQCSWPFTLPRACRHATLYPCAPLHYSGSRVSADCARGPHA